MKNCQAADILSPTEMAFHEYYLQIQLSYSEGLFHKNEINISKWPI